MMILNIRKTKCLHWTCVLSCDVICMSTAFYPQYDVVCAMFILFFYYNEIRTEYKVSKQGIEKRHMYNCKQ